MLALPNIFALAAVPGFRKEGNHEKPQAHAENTEDHKSTSEPTAFFIAVAVAAVGTPSSSAVDFLGRVVITHGSSV